MPTTLSFEYTHPYGNLGQDGIVIPVNLMVGDNQVQLLAKLDTGASNCLFQRDYGEQLGLLIEAGRAITMNTANSSFMAFGHEVSIRCFQWEFNAEVFFPQSYDIRRNLLGRNGWLQQFQIALIDYDEVLHLHHYNRS